MNTVGKILVILNFLFAITVGALLVMNAAIGNNWKAAHDAQVKENKILRGGRDTETDANRNIANDYQREVTENDRLKQKIDKDAKDFKDVKDGLLAEARIREQKIADQSTTLAETAATLKRSVEEINQLYTTIKDREKLIAKHEADNKVLRAAAKHSESQLADARGRNENLLEQLRGITVAQAKDKAGVIQGAVKVINPNEPNPPAVAVNGKVEKVDGDLVLISLGTDHNVNKDNTLDIYRLQPESKYLGMIRIVSADHHKSVARLIPSGNAAFRPALREGDLVTSKLTK